MKDLVKTIVCPLVDHPDEVVVTENETDKVIRIRLRVAEKDMGKVIGKQGKTIKAIRTVVKSAPKNDRKKVVVELDS